MTHRVFKNHAYSKRDAKPLKQGPEIAKQEKKKKKKNKKKTVEYVSQRNQAGSAMRAIN
jgi:hypothetical protein